MNTETNSILALSRCSDRRNAVGPSISFSGRFRPFHSQLGPSSRSVLEFARFGLFGCNSGKAVGPLVVGVTIAAS